MMTDLPHHGPPYHRPASTSALAWCADPTAAPAPACRSPEAHPAAPYPPTPPHRPARAWSPGDHSALSSPATSTPPTQPLLRAPSPQLPCPSRPRRRPMLLPARSSPWSSLTAVSASTRLVPTAKPSGSTPKAYLRSSSNSARSPAVQLGGVHALAGLADDAPDDSLRQTCIDVLCAYLQLLSTTDPGDAPCPPGGASPLPGPLQGPAHDPAPSVTTTTAPMDPTAPGRAATSTSPASSSTALCASTARRSPVTGCPSTVQRSPAARCPSSVRRSPAPPEGENGRIDELGSRPGSHHLSRSFCHFLFEDPPPTVQTRLDDDFGA